MKITLGIMSSKWEMEAKNADVAVAVIRLLSSFTGPIAIYDPVGAKSKFAILVSTDRKQQKDFNDFLSKNVAEIRKAYKTMKTLS